MSSPPSTPNYLKNLGLGYSIAIALGFLFLLSSFILTFYFCCRNRNRNRNRNNNSNNNPNNFPTSDGVVLPRIIFVAEDEDGEDQNTAMGLDQNVINSYPRFQFTKEGSSVGQNTTCSICLCEYKESEMLRMMPECHHYFHLCCLDSWLKLNGSCPVCRNSPLPTPLSTPLQEVVPLSQHGADRRRR